MDGIIRQIEQDNWEEALRLFVEYSKTGSMDLQACIIGATIMEHYGDKDASYRFIVDGLKLDPSNYELHILLGNYYSDTNPDRAYLYYENALYNSIRSTGEDSDDTVFIRQTLDTFKENNEINVRNVSFVILSYNEIEHTRNCISGIRNSCYAPCYEIIVVDNASTDGSVEWLRQQSDITLIENSENVGFPAGTNQGIKAADPSNDIFLLNNDTILMSDSLLNLRIGLYEDKFVGATGAVTNNLSREQVVETKCSSIEEFEQFAISNNIPSENSYEDKIYLVMFAMLIKREAFDRTGLLDELYTPGNFEDNDYGIRLTQNGYRCVLCHNAFIYHVGSASFGKDVRKYNELYMINYGKFKNKWGFASDTYLNPRTDIVDMIERDSGDRFSVLEIGCGFGETLTKIRYRYPNSSVKGIELNKTIADIAGKRLDVVCANIEECAPEGEYDYIILADILDRINNPVAVLKKLRENLTANGSILVSLPNAMNAGRVYELLTGRIPFEEDIPKGMARIHHFTVDTMREMIEKSGYTISDLYTTSLPDKSVDMHREFFDLILKTEGVASKEFFDIYQFLVRIIVSDQSE